MNIKLLIILFFSFFFFNNFSYSKLIVPKLKPDKFLEKSSKRNTSTIFQKEKKGVEDKTKKNIETEKKLTQEKIQKDTVLQKNENIDLRPKIKPDNKTIIENNKTQTSLKQEETKKELLNSNFLNQKDFEMAKIVFGYIEKKQWRLALSDAKKIEDKSFYNLVNWLFLIDPESQGLFSEYQEFINQNKEWPRLNRIKYLGEHKINFENNSPTQIVNYFSKNPPLSGFGRLRLAEAYLELREIDKVKNLIDNGFKDAEISKNDLKYFSRIFKKYLTPVHYVERADYFSYEAKYKDLRDTIEYLPQDYQKLYNARAALFTKRSADNLISAVPDYLKNDPGLIYDRIKWRRKKGRFDDALKLLNVGTSENLLKNEYLAKERLVLGRDRIQDKEYTEAYEILKNHGLKDGNEHAEIEWHLGWLSLTFLNQPERALGHFIRMNTTVSYPVSKARATYWIAKTYKQLGKTEDAQKFFKIASEYPTTFYGQLALFENKVDKYLINNNFTINKEKYLEFKNKNQLARAVLYLKEIDKTKYSKDILRHLGDIEQNRTNEELSMAALLAQEIERYDFSIQISKNASYKNVILLDSSYPRIEVPKEIKKKIINNSVVLALIRQESEFDTSAISKVGAKGLMQIMPATGRVLSRETDVQYSKEKLIKDKDYNLQLGSYYIADLIEDFNSYYLAFAAYNAGPNRVEKWIKSHGDPRKKQIDPITFIELIPFQETRNYVQRVIENINVYEFLQNKENAKNKIGKLIYENQL